MGKFLDKVLLWSGPIPLHSEQALGGGFVFLMDKNVQASVLVCRNFLTSWLTGSQAHGGNVDTGLPRRAGWGPGSWRLWDVCHHHAGAKCSVRTSKVDFFSGKFSLDGSFGSHWCSVHWILRWGKNFIYSKIPVFSYSHPHLSLRMMSQVFLLMNCSSRDRVLDLAGNWSNWRLEGFSPNFVTGRHSSHGS